MNFIIREYCLISTENGVHINPTVLISLMIGLILFIIFVIVFITKNRTIKDSDPFFIPIGRIGQVTELLSTTYHGSPLYHIKVAGEIWQVRALHNEILNLNDEVEIISQEKNLLILNVKKRGRT